MWFKNLTLYRLPAPLGISLEQLAEQLARGPFEKCQSNQPQSRGWVSPRRDGNPVYAQDRQWLIALRTEQRLLPSSVVNQEVKERAEALETQQDYAPGRAQLKELRERVTQELMPRAFTKQRTTYAWINPVGGWLVIDAGSPSKAEEVIEHLRCCLDPLPISLPKTAIHPQTAMADWLAGDAPRGFSIDYDCELKACSEEKATVKFARGPLDPNKINAHLAEGKLPTKLALTFDNRISFVLTEKLEVKRLHFLDLLKEQADKSAENADDQFAADFAPMTGELSRFLPQLLEALSGEINDLDKQGGGAPTAQDGDQDDEFAYAMAVKIVQEAKAVSVYGIRRDLHIGYNRAVRIIERMEREGLISAPDETGKREVIETTTETPAAA